MKCKAHNQGDRCRKEAGHEEVDPVHEGQFAIWQENKFREDKSARTAPRRNRQRNQFFRRVISHALIQRRISAAQVRSA